MKLHACFTCAVIALLLSCGCTSLKGSSGSVAVTSSPPGAEVFFDGIYSGITPMVIERISPGVHEVLLKGEGNSTFETSITVTPGGTASVSWENPIIVVKPSVTPGGAVFSVTNMKGYRGGGDYITSLSYDISLASGAKPVNMSEARINLKTGSEIISPYWQIADKNQANTDNILETGEVFSITMRTPRLGQGDSFTLTIFPETGEPFTITQTMPGTVGLDVRF
jgi:hypothetical protein